MKKTDLPEPPRLHLRCLSSRAWPESQVGIFPFNLPILKNLDELTFSAPVTFLVGENGSGKSTLLEALACAVGSITVGRESVNTDPSLDAVRRFSRHLKLTWNRRTRRGFFLRAEDFFGYARRLAEMRQEFEDDLANVDREYVGRSKLAVDLGKLPYNSQISALRNSYGDGLDARSHGESFLALFQGRFVPGGLYLLDEPEAPLSPIRQLAFIAALQEMTRQDSQFIIATHSPIIMAFPHAQILNFDGGRIRPANYEELEHVRITRDFLNNPGAFLQYLSAPAPEEPA